MFFEWYGLCNTYWYRSINDGETDMTTKIYITGTTIWLVALAHVADFNLFDHVQMVGLAGQSLF